MKRRKDRKMIKEREVGKKKEKEKRERGQKDRELAAMLQYRVQQK